MTRTVRIPNGIKVRVSAKEQQFAALVARRLVFESNRRLVVGGVDPHCLSCRPDLLFERGMVAVFYDGCYWHECPDHYPNARGGLGRQQDERNNTLLPQMGWTVLRVWEHEDPRTAAQRVVESVRAIRTGYARQSKES